MTTDRPILSEIPDAPLGIPASLLSRSPPLAPFPTHLPVFSPCLPPSLDDPLRVRSLPSPPDRFYLPLSAARTRGMHGYLDFKSGHFVPRVPIPNPGYNSREIQTCRQRSLDFSAKSRPSLSPARQNFDASAKHKFRAAQ